MHKAYLADVTRMHHLQMWDLYRVICMGDEGVDPGIVAKVCTWKQKRSVMKWRIDSSTMELAVSR